MGKEANVPPPKPDISSLPDYPRGLTFEHVWAALMEDRERMRKSEEKWEKEREEERLKWEEERLQREEERLKREKEREKDNKEWRERSARLDKQLGELGNRFGELAEHLVGPSITEKFNEKGFVFTQISRNVQIVFPDDPKTWAEVDILLENGDIVIAVEIKATPEEKDVNKHKRRMEILRMKADMKGDKRKYQGAIAGAIMDKDICDYILQNGFYLIEQTGDTVKLTIPEDFTAREW